MTFLNSALLAGLAAVALPLLIHLLSRRKYPRIDFSTLRFLKQLQRHQMRRLKLRQWLLLLLRTLAVFFIVFAFLRPAWRRDSGFGAFSAGRTGIAVILDGSASMQAAGNQGTCFQAAKSAAAQVLSLMNSGDRAMLMLARGRPERLTEQPLGDPEVLRKQLDRAEAWDGSADLAAACADAVQALSKTQEFRREIYLISDFNSATALPAPPEGYQLYLVQVHPASRENVSISKIRVLSEIIEPGQPVDLEVTLTNHGKRDREDLYYSLFLNDTRVAEDVVSVQAGAEVHRRHSVQPVGEGLQRGTAQLDEQDVLAVDNRAYFCFAVPDEIRVLLVGEPQAVREIRLALAPSGEIERLLKVQSVGRNLWDTADLSRCDVLIFSDPPDFTGAQAARLENFVRNGGGLMLLPGPKTNIPVVNRDLLVRLGTPQWGELIGASGSGDAFLQWRQSDSQSPLFAGILRSGQAPASPRFFRSVRIFGGNATVPLQLSNGAPFFSLSEVGQGRVLLASSSPQAEWSDWARRGIFAPLMHRLVLILTRSGAERCRMIQVGEALEFRSGSVASGTSAAGSEVAILVTPDQQEIKLPPQTGGQAVVYRWQETQPSGIFLFRAGNTSAVAAVNVPPEESDLAEIHPGQTYPEWKAAGAIVTDEERLVQDIRASRYGKELWRSALIAGLIMLFLETVFGASRWLPNPKSDEKERVSDIIHKS
jgi:hypothetical protein